MLEVQSLEVAYGPAKVLHNVSLTVAQGQVVTLIGPNGAGKSTLLRAISGLIRHASGCIRMGDAEITGCTAEAIVALGVVQVPEGRRIFTKLTVYENLLMGAYLLRDRKVEQQRLESVYALFPRLAERKQQIAGTMSGGERQMLAFGRALMAGPKVLLLDEPSMGLAPQMVERIRELITKINAEQGLSILLIEQNAHLALSVASHCYVIENGRIVASGTTDELRASDVIERAYLGA